MGSWKFQGPKPGLKGSSLPHLVASAIPPGDQSPGLGSQESMDVTGNASLCPWAIGGMRSNMIKLSRITSILKTIDLLLSDGRTSFIMKDVWCSILLKANHFIFWDSQRGALGVPPSYVVHDWRVNNHRDCPSKQVWSESLEQVQPQGTLLMGGPSKLELDRCIDPRCRISATTHPHHWPAPLPAPSFPPAAPRILQLQRREGQKSGEVWTSYFDSASLKWQVSTGQKVW